MDHVKIKNKVVNYKITVKKVKITPSWRRSRGWRLHNTYTYNPAREDEKNIDLFLLLSIRAGGWTIVRSVMINGQF